MTVRTRPLAAAARLLAAPLLLLAAAGCTTSATTIPDPGVPRTPKAAPPQFSGLVGCFTMVELGTGETVEYGGDECDVQTSPASTFKIPNALIGLDTGVVQDENTVFRWNGKEYWKASWNRDHSLATSMWYSTVWYFQRIAEQVGEPRYRTYLSAFRYGNADPSGDVTMFWLNSTLRISPRENRRFLTAFYENKLPVSPRATAIVKRILELRGDAVEHVRDRLPFVDAIPANVVLSGKTGSYLPNDGPLGPLDAIGWFVGALEKEGRTWVFACRIRSNDEKKIGPEAAKISYEILKGEGLL
ncbi:penicillin-binding transpeptidase domain-containing protein [Polyangium sp. y55x31]|uniref:penicillin-binding transpeptidase domain-containing protein n=1 Tax=Polyangium sp. y55x31 TaxID=3042688 RepID=UPI0024821F84|nr:penicillin-binding transpeptidase domain-containing protein [Polyangium sp. y55x31]MDI1481441.1 penicillin-binding transpeptidase domain-containing protein [Polyangium sp. y55x31]